VCDLFFFSPVQGASFLQTSFIINNSCINSTTVFAASEGVIHFTDSRSVPDRPPDWCFFQILAPEHRFLFVEVKQNDRCNATVQIHDAGSPKVTKTMMKVMNPDPRYFMSFSNQVVLRYTHQEIVLQGGISKLNKLVTATFLKPHTVYNAIKT
jgi:hypothetical protein